MRAKRQQLILKSMVLAVTQAGSAFLPFDIKQFYEAVTAIGRMKTSLSLDDAVYLWDFHKDEDKYVVESFVVDTTYVYHPGVAPESEYSAWVYLPKETNWAQLQSAIKIMLGVTESEL